MSLTNDIFSALKEFDDYRREQREEFLSYKKSREQYRGSAGYSEEIRKASEKRERAVADAKKAASTKIDACLKQMRENVGKMPIKAPSQEMVNILQVLSMKSTISKQELDRAARAMEGNALGLSALNSIADKHYYSGSPEGSSHTNYSLMSNELTEEALNSHINNVVNHCKGVFETSVKRAAYLEARRQTAMGINVDYDALTQREPLTTANDFYSDIMQGSTTIDSFYQAVNG